MTRHSPIKMAALTRLRNVGYFEAHNFTYLVTKTGRVFSLTGQFKHRELKQHQHRAGYKIVFLCGRKRVVKYVHRLVAESFLGQVSGKQVNHKNGIKTDNRLENLEWVSRSENQLHSHANYLGPGGTHRKLRDAKLIQLVNGGVGRKEIAKTLSLAPDTVTKKAIRAIGVKPKNTYTANSQLHKNKTKIKELAARGLYIAEIARALKIHPQVIHEARRLDPSIVFCNGRQKRFERDPLK